MIFNAYSDNSNGLYGVSLKSGGHIFAKKDRCIKRPDGRDDWLLFYVAKGCETFYFDTVQKAEAGSFVIFRPHEKQHHIYLEDKTGEFYFVHFDAPEDFDIFGLESSVIYSAKPSAKVCDMFEAIINELFLKQVCYEKLCVSMLFELLSVLVRRVADMTNPHKRYIDKISYILQIMNREYNKNYSLESYASMCNMSKFHFIRIFGDITGMSPVEYRNKIRMEHAKELLEESDMTISEISSSLGFSSASYFCDAFKKKNGISPAGYRRKSNH